MRFIKFLKFPLWLLKLFIKKPKKKVSKRQKNQRAYVRNFDPVCLKNRTWQKSLGKSKKKREGFSSKKSKISIMVVKNRSEKNLNKKPIFPNEQEIERITKQFSDPNCKEINIGLSPNATELDKAKYDI